MDRRIDYYLDCQYNTFLGLNRPTGHVYNTLGRTAMF
jgi:hypothetical protein